MPLILGVIGWIIYTGPGRDCTKGSIAPGLLLGAALLGAAILGSALVAGLITGRR